ncbi:MAG: hypothetical protein K6E75_12210 [Lachnospiraceae bacterium]|nr:hypothetical protein [Lachnospiraceae bacterium]
MNIKYRRKQLHINNQGAAMIVVVCVLMVMMILCLSMIAGAYQMMASVNDGLGDVTCYQQAMTFSEVLKAQLVTGDTEIAIPAEGGGVTFGLKEYVQAFGAKTSDFSEEKKEVTCELTTADEHGISAGAGYGDVHLFLKKISLGSSNNRLFVTTVIEKDGQPMSSVIAGYDISLSGGGNMKVAFRAYY